jgi:hypothetical protein
LNSKHLVALRDHGDRTIVTHCNGEVLVEESQTAILAALRLRGTHRTSEASNGLTSIQ